MILNIHFCPALRLYMQRGTNFDIKIRRDNEKISYERRVYESVDDKSHL